MRRAASKKSKRQIAWEKTYAFREYGATEAQLKGLAAWAEKDYQKQKRAGTLIKLTPELIKEMLK